MDLLYRVDDAPETLMARLTYQGRTLQSAQHEQAKRQAGDLDFIFSTTLPPVV